MISQVAIAGSSSHYQLVYTVRRHKSTCCLVCSSRPRRPYSVGPMVRRTPPGPSGVTGGTGALQRGGSGETLARHVSRPQALATPTTLQLDTAPPTTRPGPYRCTHPPTGTDRPTEPTDAPTAAAAGGVGSVASVPGGSCCAAGRHQQHCRRGRVGTGLAGWDWSAAASHRSIIAVMEQSQASSANRPAVQKVRRKRCIVQRIQLRFGRAGPGRAGME